MIDLVIIALYIAGMIGIGFYAKSRAKTESDFLVAGRRLGPLLYSGTMAAVVIGGASTIGGVGLGYQYGISGMWLVFAIGCGILLLSFGFASRINRLQVYTVGQMLQLRYGPGASLISGVVMWAYTLMLAVTSTIAYGTIFGVLFDLGKVPSILIGGAVVVTYSMLGGMWSITLTDFVQFIIKTVGIFVLLLPAALIKAGGFAGLKAHLPADAFSLTHIGGGTILTYFVIYFFGLVIGQDIWQRVFTARSDSVARWAGGAAGFYCLLYAVAGALIGMSAKVLLPGLTDRDDAYPEVVEAVLPVGLSGLVIAAALAAIMSTSSGALIATATVAKEDIVSAVKRRLGRSADPEVTDEPGASTGGGAGGGHEADEVKNSRWYILVFGVLTIVIACILGDVVAALTVAYDILVGGLLVAILGGMLWKRATITGALASIITGTVLTLGTMIAVGDIYANSPIFAGLAGSLVAYVVGSLASKPTPQAIRDEWDARIGHERHYVAPSDETSTTV
ncbi:sodium:solute symporter family protein [Microlunatus ginsengisoli]|uniref:Sodium:solute symporter n=1 Tax=Microlunatus ginsengisoli TaxID=363863 RepID=A0ABP7AJ83_9ACTN